MTRADWYKKLPQPARSQAQINTLDYDPILLNLKESTMLGALAGGFDWDNTPEGYDYWDQIAFSYE